MLLACASVIAACGATVGAGATGTPDGGLTYIGLLDQLRALGAHVQDGGQGSGGFAAGGGHLLIVNGVRLNVFEYATTHAASQDAALISPDGSTIKRTDASGVTHMTILDFIAPPHWFITGHVIVLYVGCDSSLMGLLQQVLGSPIAGSGTVESPCPDRPQVTPTQ